MKFIPAIMALGLLGLASAAAAPVGPPAFSGKFVIAYQPVYCIKAPCPLGAYAVAADGRRVVTGRAVEIDPAASAGLKSVFSAEAYFGGIAVEGDCWLEGGTIVIRPARAIPGHWKNEPPPGPEAGVAAAPVTLTVVNRTGDVMRGLHAAPAAADHWGPDRLGGNLGIGQKAAIDLPTPDCVYDVRIVLGDRPSEEIRRHNVCRDPVLIADRSGKTADRAR